MNIVKTLYSNYRIARQDARTSFILRKRHYKELYKFRDARRIAIAKQFPLSKEQKEAIDDLYETNYGKRIGYIYGIRTMRRTQDVLIISFSQRFFISQSSRHIKIRITQQ